VELGLAYRMDPRVVLELGDRDPELQATMLAVLEDLEQ
jgi:hypothetical protein